MNRKVSIVSSFLSGLGLLYVSGCGATRPPADSQSSRWSRPEWICLEQVLSKEEIGTLEERGTPSKEDSIFTAMHGNLEGRFLAFLDNWHNHSTPRPPDNGLASELYSLFAACYNPREKPQYQVIQSDLSFFILPDGRFDAFLSTGNSGPRTEYVLKNFRPQLPSDKVLYLSSAELSDDVGVFEDRLLRFLDSGDHVSRQVPALPQKEREERRNIASKYLPLQINCLDGDSVFLEPSQEVLALVLNESRTRGIVTYAAVNLVRQRQLWEKQADGHWEHIRNIRGL